MKKYTKESFEADSYLAAGNADYVEQLYEQFLEDQDSVSAAWRQYFTSLGGAGVDKPQQPIVTRFKKLAQAAAVVSTSVAPAEEKQQQVDNLIEAYRRYGHLDARFDPLEKVRRPELRLSLSYHQLLDSDLSKTFSTNGVLKKAFATLKEIVTQLQIVYCGTLAIEYDYVSNDEEFQWLKREVEQSGSGYSVSDKDALTALKRLTAAEGLEHYLAKKYVGQKRFSIEGGESLIPALDTIIEDLTKSGVKEVLIGMAHRGRLNVQLNVMGREPQTLFDAFEGKSNFGETTGDVKYHMGFSNDLITPYGEVHISLAFNPSHLSYINPVLIGSVRARQDMQAEGAKDYAVPIIVHGDAAFSGLGIEMETLAMSLTPAYAVGGSLHLILNNQIGYTTEDPADARSSVYCSGVAKMIEAPVIHANGDDVEAVIRAVKLAVAYRMRFHKDVVIDLVCYRRHGHNEADEPSATSPLTYNKLRAHPTTRKIYADQLVAKGLLSEAGVTAMQKSYAASLKGNIVLGDFSKEKSVSSKYSMDWEPYLDKKFADHVADTRYALGDLTRLASLLTTLPDGFVLQRQVGKMVMTSRQEMAAGNRPLDWGFAELLAYASLLESGHSVRFSGEDVRRGTFAHRHAYLHDVNTGEEYSPLQEAEAKGAKLSIYNSLLNEAAVLGFEYGYASFSPKNLVIWEAQFGDFANGAQVIIDQFISSAWQKWRRLSGLVMLLPHGMEGMGPEHSSARLERYLQLAAQENMQICVPTTPAQIFHLLRRQVLHQFRRPLIVMSPKSLLRHKLASSSLSDLAEGAFEQILLDNDMSDLEKVHRVVLCSGKVYYDLFEKRKAEDITDIAIIRIEQLYPFPYDALKSVLASYPAAKDVVWCQEEPKNQGAWFTGGHRIRASLTSEQTLRYVGRDPMAAPAAGYAELFKKQQHALVEAALAP